MYGHPPHLPSFPTRRSSDLQAAGPEFVAIENQLAELSKPQPAGERPEFGYHSAISPTQNATKWVQIDLGQPVDRKSTRLNSSHPSISYAVFCLKKKKTRKSS